jgi:hypothetical protein
VFHLNPWAPAVLRKAKGEAASHRAAAGGIVSYSEPRNVEWEIEPNDCCSDAWWVEPVRHGRFAMGHPFLDLPNVIGSPHNSAGGGAWRDEYLRRAVQNCRRAILGETPWNLIGPDERML